MKKYISVLKTTKLFAGVDEKDIEAFIYKKKITGGIAVLSIILMLVRCSVNRILRRKVVPC